MRRKTDISFRPLLFIDAEKQTLKIQGYVQLLKSAQQLQNVFCYILWPMPAFASKHTNNAY
jgi:hypothetical protein